MNETKTRPKYLTVSEVAQTLRLSESRVRRLLATGKLRGQRRGVGGNWIVREDWLEAYLQAGSETPAQNAAAARAGDEAAQKKLRAIGYEF